MRDWYTRFQRGFFQLRSATRCVLPTAHCPLPTVLLLSAFCLLPSVRAQDTPADNWSQFRGNHSLTGVSQSNPPGELKLLWTYEAGDSIESSAAIVGSTVFVGTQKGELLSLNLITARSTGSIR